MLPRLIAVAESPSAVPRPMLAPMPRAATPSVTIVAPSWLTAWADLSCEKTCSPCDRRSALSIPPVVVMSPSFSASAPPRDPSWETLSPRAPVPSVRIMPPASLTARAVPSPETHTMTAWAFRVLPSDRTAPLPVVVIDPRLIAVADPSPDGWQSSLSQLHELAESPRAPVPSVRIVPPASLTASAIPAPALLSARTASAPLSLSLKSPVVVTDPRLTTLAVAVSPEVFMKRPRSPFPLVSTVAPASLVASTLA